MRKREKEKEKKRKRKRGGVSVVLNTKQTCTQEV
jgi:hypothetical protein